MTENSPHNLQLALTDPGETGRIVVSMEAFFDFSFWMAEELQDLVARYKHHQPRSTPPRQTHGLQQTRD